MGREDEALCRLPGEGVDVVDEHEQACEVLAPRNNAELRGLLDRVDGVAAGVGKADDLCLGCLLLEKDDEKSLPGTVCAPCRYLAAALQYDRFRIALERGPKA